MRGRDYWGSGLWSGGLCQEYDVLGHFNKVNRLRFKQMGQNGKGTFGVIFENGAKKV